MITIPIGLSALVGYSLAEDPDEPHLGWKLLGHAVLGYVSFRLGALVLPLGFLVALGLWSGALVNRRARLVTSALTCLLWGLGFA